MRLNAKPLSSMHSLALPFFMIGNMAQKYIDILNRVNCRNISVLMLTLICILIIVVSVFYNPAVRVYRNEYGSLFSLYLLSGLAGVTLVYILSKLTYVNKWGGVIKTLSQGNLLTLGIHIYLITLLKAIMPTSDVLYYVLAFVILVFMYPIIKLAERKAPYLIGK